MKTFFPAELGGTVEEREWQAHENERKEVGRDIHASETAMTRGIIRVIHRRTRGRLRK